MLQFGDLAHKRIYYNDADAAAAAVDDDDDDDDKAILPFPMSSPHLSLVCMPTLTVGCLLFTFATDQRFA